MESPMLTSKVWVRDEKSQNSVHIIPRITHATRVESQEPVDNADRTRYWGI